MTLLHRAERAVRWQAMTGAVLAWVSGSTLAGVLLLAALLIGPLLRDRKHPMVLSHWAVNIGVGVATAWLLVEVLGAGPYATPLPRLTMVVQYLCILQAMRALEVVRSPRDVGQTVVLSLVMVAISALCDWGLLFGVGLLIYLSLAGNGVVALCVASQGADAGAEKEEVPPEAVRGLRGSVARATLAVLAIAVAVFLLFPRIPTFPRWPQYPGESSGLSGFAEQDQLQLGDINRIQQDQTPIMWVSVSSGGEDIGSPNIPLYLRGKTYDTYAREHGRYFWQDRCIGYRTSDGRPPQYTIRDGQVFGQEAVRNHGRDLLGLSRLPTEQFTIELQDPGGRALFAPYAAERIASGSSELESVQVHRYDTTLWQPDDRRGRVVYTVFRPAPRPGDRNQVRAEVADALHDIDADYMTFYGNSAMLDAVSPRLRGFVDREILRGTRQDDPYLLARDIEQYLIRNYNYSRSFRAIPQGAEPIEAFLDHPHGEGRHCEYFAAAMTLLCRSKGLPSRLVTGFRTGEWNSTGSFYVVKKMHAHSWVEVYIDATEGRERLGWVTFDPTPADDQTPEGWTAWLGYLIDYLRASWRQHIDQYGAEQQNWMRQFFNEYSGKAGRWAHRQMQRLESWLRQFVGDAAGVVGAILVTAGGVVLFGGLAVVAAVLVRRRRRRRRGPATGARAAPQPQVEFYRRLLELLARRGHIKPAAQTACEFAAHLGRVAAGSLPIADIEQVVACYNRLRYGLAPPTPAQQALIDRTLETLARVEPLDDGQ